MNSGGEHGPGPDQPKISMPAMPVAGTSIVNLPRIVWWTPPSRSCGLIVWQLDRKSLASSTYVVPRTYALTAETQELSNDSAFCGNTSSISTTGSAQPATSAIAVAMRSSI
jgi:hypothetical protein